MKISEAFASKYLKAEDLNGEEVVSQIQSISQEDTAGNGQKKDFKPVVYLHGLEQGLVLNKVNALMTAEFYGDETDNWVGLPLAIRVEKVMYRGDMVPGIRVMPQDPSMQAAGAKLKKILAAREEAEPEPASIK